MRTHNKCISSVSLGLVATLWLAGCVTNKTTVTARSATEQLLLSTATDHALQDIGLEMFAGRKVFLDATYFDSYDSKYVVGSIRDGLSRAGALLARLREVYTQSEVIGRVVQRRAHSIVVK